jgi:hypothetical protein
MSLHAISPDSLQILAQQCQCNAFKCWCLTLAPDGAVHKKLLPPFALSLLHRTGTAIDGRFQIHITWDLYCVQLSSDESVLRGLTSPHEGASLFPCHGNWTASRVSSYERALTTRIGNPNFDHLFNASRVEPLICIMAFASNAGRTE